MKFASCISVVRKDSGFEEEALTEERSTNEESQAINDLPALACKQTDLCHTNSQPANGSETLHEDSTPPQLPSRSRKVAPPNVMLRRGVTWDGPLPPPPPPRPKHTLTQHSSMRKIPDRPLPPLPKEANITKK